MSPSDRIRAAHLAALLAMDPEDRRDYLDAIRWRRMASVGAFPLAWVIAR